MLKYKIFLFQFLVQNDRRNQRGNIVPAKIGILTSLITITYSLLFSLTYTLSSLWTSRRGSWSWASWRTPSTAWCLLWCWRAGRSPWGRSSSSSTAATRTKCSLSTRIRINEKRWIYVTSIHSLWLLNYLLHSWIKLYLFLVPPNHCRIFNRFSCSLSSRTSILRLSMSSQGNGGLSRLHLLYYLTIDPILSPQLPLSPYFWHVPGQL